MADTRPAPWTAGLAIPTGKAISLSNIDGGAHFCGRWYQPNGGLCVAANVTNMTECNDLRVGDSYGEMGFWDKDVRLPCGLNVASPLNDSL